MACDPARPRPPRRRFAEIPTLIADVRNRLTEGRRFVLGITGPPGAGKSRLAGEIERQLGAPVAPMDGFHRSNDDLAAAGLLALKGVPDSFDASGFVAQLRELCTSPPLDVRWPTYDRASQEVVPNGVLVRASDRLVVVEGNYLLLDTPPWHEVKPLLDLIWYLDVAQTVLRPRLLERHGRDRPPADAARKVASTDLPNAALVAASRQRADLIIIDA
jgi:pantothenate kinase